MHDISSSGERRQDGAQLNLHFDPPLVPVVCGRGLGPCVLILKTNDAGIPILHCIKCGCDGAFRSAP